MKPFEIHIKRYCFRADTRKIWNEPMWLRFRGYETEYGVNQAIEVIRKQPQFRDYPGEGFKSRQPEDAKKFIDTINFYRYKIVKV